MIEIDRTLPTYAIFFAGGLALYLFRSRIIEAVNPRGMLLCGVLVAVIGCALPILGAPGSEWTIAAGLIMLAAYLLSQPTRRSRIDTLLGDLSYPVFILHPITIQTGVPQQAAEAMFGPSVTALFALNIALSVAIAYTVNAVIAPIIEAMRQRNRTALAGDLAAPSPSAL
jgi:peptidoglycan/LPS O-acetylase OafA/YrhL